MSLAERPVADRTRNPDDGSDADGAPGRLAAIAAELGQGAARALVPPGATRRWSDAIETDDYEAVVIAWPPGTGLRMHDHDGSLAAIYVINGRLRERYVDASGRVKVRWLEAGHTTDLPRDHVHEVINLHEQEVVSVHVYSPPLGDDSFRVDREIDINRSSS